jgi:N6-adenosine-specific RNA methylase IME4
MCIMQRFTSLFLKFKSNLLVKRVSTLRETGYDAENRFSWLRVRSSYDVYEHGIETSYSINASNFFLMIFIIRMQ